jgi:cytoskeletal protein CcmA (bactofilin family)
MFGKKPSTSVKKHSTSIKTLIAHGTRVQGDLEFEDGMRVDGEVHGAISAKSGSGSMLVISEGAVVEGGVKADHVIVNGTVKGPIEAHDALELQAKAKVEGDVQYAALAMEHGATILGQLRPLQALDDAADGEKKVIKLAATSA